MSRPNRVAPDGSLHAVTARGELFGNRGVLVDANGHLRRPFGVTRWIACELEFRGRRRAPQWQPGRYSELYFLDEATALAAGHRPCAECRRADFAAFAAAWARAQGLTRPPRVTEMDAVLHAERLGPRRRLVDDVPAGVMVAAGDAWWLALDDGWARWGFEGYGAPVATLPPGPATVLTPPSTAATLASGYRVRPHSSQDVARRGPSPDL